MTDLEATLALNLLPGLGPVKMRRLLDVFGCPEAILQASRTDLQRVSGIGPEMATQIHHWQKHVDLPAELQLLEERGLQFVISSNPLYPSTLREIYDPPLGLYVWGELLERDQHAIAVVGARNCTHYGIQAARKLSFQLAHAGVTVLSGLARGIDTAAHEGAIAAGGRTIAVIGSGLGQIYPPENFPLAQRIAESHGAIVSEFPIQWGPNKQTFPLRNRIVSGWSKGVLVIEAPERSGSLITANLANEQGRPVYAVPGPIDRDSSAGCHRLIQDGARLVIDASDILSDFEQLRFTPNSSQKSSSQETAKTAPNLNDLALNEDEKRVIESLGSDLRSGDELIEACDLAASQLLPLLLNLELKGLVKSHPGSRFSRA